LFSNALASLGPVQHLLVMVCRIAALLTVVTAAAAARAPLLSATANEVPKWACALHAAQDEVNKFLAPGLHKLFATGNATKDLEDAASVEKAAENLEKEEATKAKALTKDSEVASSEAVADAKKSEDLDAQAKKETNNTSAAKKDSEQAVELAGKAVNASTKAKNITEQANSIEATAQIQSQQMFAIAAQLKKDAADEAKQAVQAVDSSSLTALVAKEDVFVVFYAPWCPHCQTYVMHDEAGSAENAPIEKLNEHLKNGVKVVKFDVDAHQPPAGFDVKYIPTSYFANKDVKAKYEADPMDFDAVEKFTEADHKTGAAASSAPAITVIAKKHEVTIKASPVEVNAFDKLRAAAKLGREMKREQ